MKSREGTPVALVVKGKDYLAENRNKWEIRIFYINNRETMEPQWKGTYDNILTRVQNNINVDLETIEVNNGFTNLDIENNMEMVWIIS
jgi:hypothetical protein